MKHEKTFEAINKLKDIELELHRLKNALEMANKALDAQREWVGLTDEKIKEIRRAFVQYIKNGQDEYAAFDFAFDDYKAAHGIKGEA